jgi:hypothetical protein
MCCLATGWSLREGIYDGGAAFPIGWNMLLAAILPTSVGPGSSVVGLGDKGLVVVMIPGPLTGSLVKPPEGSPVKKLYGVLVSVLLQNIRDSKLPQSPMTLQ